jgi:hypothetical protein
MKAGQLLAATHALYPASGIPLNAVSLNRWPPGLYC